METNARDASSAAWAWEQLDVKAYEEHIGFLFAELRPSDPSQDVSLNY